MLDNHNNDEYYHDIADQVDEYNANCHYFDYIPRGQVKRIENACDPDYYHSWKLLSNIREYPNNYSAVFMHDGCSLLLSIPKKIVRGVCTDKLLVHTKIFYDIMHKRLQAKEISNETIPI